MLWKRKYKDVNSVHHSHLQDPDDIGSNDDNSNGSVEKDEVC